MPRSSRIRIIWVNTNATVCGVYRALSIWHKFGKYNRLWTYIVFNICAVHFLLRTKIAKERLQEYILSLRFYGRERDIPLRDLFQGPIILF